MACINALCKEYQEYLDAQGLPDGDALELLHFPRLHQHERIWLSDFIRRWEEAATSPDFFTRQRVVL